MKKLEDARSKAIDVDRISGYLGFQVELIEEDVYAVQFTQLPIKEPEKRFQFDVHENGNKIKGILLTILISCAKQMRKLTLVFPTHYSTVLRVDPPECIDTNEIEDQISQSDKEASLKFFELVLRIRQKLIEKYR